MTPPKRVAFRLFSKTYGSNPNSRPRATALVRVVTYSLANSRLRYHFTVSSQNPQPFADLTVAQSFRYKPQDLNLAVMQPVYRLRTTAFPELLGPEAFPAPCRISRWRHGTAPSPIPDRQPRPPHSRP